MITITGNDILAKYLTGQTSSFASHIAIGCYPTNSVNAALSKEELNFEMARFPIISRGQRIETVTQQITTIDIAGDITIGFADNIYYVGQQIILSGIAAIPNPPDPSVSINGAYTIKSIDSTFSTFTVANTAGAAAYSNTNTFGSIGTISSNQKKIIFTAEVPSQNRYIVKEFGLYPSGTNQFSTGTDSRVLVNFTNSEGWQYLNSSTQASSNLVKYSTISDTTGNITIADKAYQTNSDNSVFDVVARIDEKPRFLDDATIVAGNLSEFTSALTATGDYISVSNFGVNLDKNSPKDELRIAYSLIRKNISTATVPKSTNIMLQFLCSNGIDNAKYHFRYNVDPTSLTGLNTTGYGRYKVLSLKLGEPKLISDTATIGTVSGSGPYTATISGLSINGVSSVYGDGGIVVGSVLTATDGTGSLGSGTMTVASIVDASTITVSSTATFTAGTVSNLSTRFSSTTSGFKWRDVVALRVYSNVETASDYSGSGTSEFAISLDAIRFENKSNTNPLYGLVAYMDAYSTSEVIKKSGEVSLVEFKVGLGIQHGI